MFIEDSSGLLQPLITILILGGIWLVVRYIFKLALKVFVSGCFVIIIVGAISLILGKSVV